MDSVRAMMEAESARCVAAHDAIKATLEAPDGPQKLRTEKFIAAREAEAYLGSQEERA
jgi:hypothetical protein